MVSYRCDHMYEGDVLMVCITKTYIDEIPCLIVTQKCKQQRALPVIVYFHGFTSAKEHNLPLAYLLAQKGFRVILPDSLHHGKRYENISNVERQLSFWDIVIQNVNELAHIKQYLEQHKMLSNGKIGVAGTSMGGITTSAALRKYPWIHSGAILMGSPKIVTFFYELLDQLAKINISVEEEKLQATLETLKQLDLSKQLKSLQERPLFIWHGENDQVVPFDHAYSFYQEAKSFYQNEQLLHFLGEKNRGHKVSRKAILQTVHWFNKHLKSHVK